MRVPLLVPITDTLTKAMGLELSADTTMPLICTNESFMESDCAFSQFGTNQSKKRETTRKYRYIGEVELGTKLASFPLDLRGADFF